MESYVEHPDNSCIGNHNDSHGCIQVIFHDCNHNRDGDRHNCGEYIELDILIGSGMSHGHLWRPIRLASGRTGTLSSHWSHT